MTTTKIDYFTYDSIAIKTISSFAQGNNLLHKKLNWLINEVVYNTPPEIANLALQATAKEVMNKRGEEIVIATLIFNLITCPTGADALIHLPVFSEAGTSNMSKDRKIELALKNIGYMFDSPQIVTNIQIMMNKK